MSAVFYAVGLLLIIASAFIGQAVHDVVLEAIYSSAAFVSGIGLIAAGAIIETISKKK